MSPQDLIAEYLLNIGHEIDNVLQPDMSPQKVQAYKDMVQAFESLERAVRRYKEAV